MVCTNCGRALAGNARFCRHCGAKAEAQKPPKRLCTLCGAPLGPGARFCKKCGGQVGVPIAAATLEAGITIPVEGPVTSVTISEAPPAAATGRFCAKCGAGLQPGAKFCKKCGAAASPAGERPNAPAPGMGQEPPARGPSPSQPGTSGPVANRARQVAEAALGQALAQLKDGDCAASTAPGEMSLPISEAQNAFMKLLRKGL